VPIYDYVCSNCGHTIEVTHPVQGDGPSACPNCGGPMKKAISAPAVHFKGTGWARKERSGGSRSPSTAKESTASEAGADPGKDPTPKPGASAS
jgi:putative FmdB family regulatory protein